MAWRERPPTRPVPSSLPCGPCTLGAITPPKRCAPRSTRRGVKERRRRRRRPW
ncbi:hypothetical protein T492DRAFT_1100127 [Pavlovales sp. CCMP2436]|nr:hypothetical protein T492DRAFT_1100127 [Pavlovales sp. CCMP2436]